MNSQRSTSSLAIRCAHMDTESASAVADGGNSNQLSKRGWKVSIFVLAMASLVTAIDLTIISVALPTVENDLELSPAAGQWVVNAYLISFTVMLIPGGMLGDRNNFV